MVQHVNATRAMSVGILKYFTLKHGSSLPSPDGSLSKVVPFENKEVKELLEVGDNCHVPSGNASGSSYSLGPSPPMKRLK